MLKRETQLHSSAELWGTTMAMRSGRYIPNPNPNPNPIVTFDNIVVLLDLYKL
jgi:hypothetical protein